MQAFPQWTPPSGTLGGLVADAHRRASALTERADRLRRAAEAAISAPSMATALRAGTVSVIAEVKRRSPSKGAINEGLSAVAQADAYARGGAAALSILTEPMSFGGSDADLREVRATSALPLLKKDFHVHPLQVFEARALGASALLLIARALDEPMLRELAAIAHDVGLEVLIEVRDERELERALETDARMIGVNNRNLETLEIDLATSELMVPQVPSDRVAIAESGVRGPEEVERFARAGADAVLVGSSISGSPDPVTAVRALTQSLRRPRS